MNIQEVKEVGIIGKEIFLTVQELIVLAELKGALKIMLTEEQFGDRPEIEHAAVFLSKITKGVASIQETFNDMFTEDIDLENLDKVKV